MSKKQIVFTDIMIRKLKPEEKKYIRGEGNGFTIRVMPSGVKTWLYAYAFDGKRRELNLGSYPEVSLETARGKFDDARKKVKNGIDPVAEKEQAAEERRKAPTVSDLITEYIEKHAKVQKRGWKEDKRILEKDALPVWGSRKAADITKRDVVLLLEKIMERGAPGSANGNFKCIRKMFNFAVERDIIKHSPCIGVKMPAPLNRRERILSETEIRTLWKSLEAAGVTDEIQRALRLIFVTAQRPGEVVGMHSSEIDGRWWTIPSKRAKNGKEHRVYLTDLALELIGDTTGKGYIFPCPHEGKVKPIEVNALAHAVRRNLAWPVLHKGKPVFDSDGKPVTENRLGIDAFTPHDGRRTAATFMSQIGFMDEVIDSLLNHVKQGIIRTYNLNRYDKEKQQALEAWERKLNSIITGTENKVIPINASKRAS
ncbi:MAG: integrase arm-type DNA-binding domain-containing protein [Desulfuromonadales bacterium]|nr:integrase arm-type DNA-binding domain-containing protein [Desulfuromonadales bacterium]